MAEALRQLPGWAGREGYTMNSINVFVDTNIVNRLLDFDKVAKLGLLS